MKPRQLKKLSKKLAVMFINANLPDKYQLDSITLDKSDIRMVNYADVWLYDDSYSYSKVLQNNLNVGVNGFYVVGLDHFGDDLDTMTVYHDVKNLMIFELENSFDPEWQKITKRLTGKEVMRLARLYIDKYKVNNKRSLIPSHIKTVEQLRDWMKEINGSEVVNIPNQLFTFDQFMEWLDNA